MLYDLWRQVETKLFGPCQAPGLRLSPRFLVFCAAAGITLLLVSGCASAPRAVSAPKRVFDFHRDTFAYRNELVWEYAYDTNGNWTIHTRKPKPTYAQHCFVMARSAWQFFSNARFARDLPRADRATYRRLIRRVVASSSRRPLPEDKKIVIPGYRDLRRFSRDWEVLLKTQCGGAWQCYFQRGNWRMILPFSRCEQERTARWTLQRVRQNQPVVLHLFRFPQLSINHAVLAFAARESPGAIQFSIYDPNRPEGPETLTFERDSRRFILPHNSYFKGGAVKAYQVYTSWDY